MNSITIADILIGPRHRRELGDIDTLMASIADVGLLQPVVLDPARNLIAGRRRVEAHRRLGRDAIPFVTADAITDACGLLRAERDENTCRKDFLPSEAVAIGRSLEQWERKEAKERQREGGRAAGNGRPKQVVESCHQLNGNGKSRDRIGRAAGMSGRQFEKAKAVVEAAEADPEKFGSLVAKMDSTRRVDWPFKQLKKIRQAEAIRNEPPPLPSGPFRVIVVDPPWRYDCRTEDPRHRAVCSYPCMSLDEIVAMPVGKLAEQDSVLWLWTTTSHLPEAFGIAAAWGFEYKTLLTWAKDRMGTGDYLRGKSEFCLMCVRGKPVINLTNQTTVISAPVRAHSQKPDEFFAMVEDLCPGSKVELFARMPRAGWVQHGDEV